MMPIDLVLVRHGESEGNLAKVRSKAGDESSSQLFKGLHSSRFRLTDRGREQAKAAGEWLRKEFPNGFGRHYTSAYKRAMETAGLLGLPNARWYVEPALRERDWGDLDVMSESDRHARFRESLAMKKVSPLYWIAPNGESVMHVSETRTYRMLGTLARECSRIPVCMVCHGETMWSFRLPLERMSDDEYNRLDASDNPFDRIHNCQILHYTRKRPEDQDAATHFTYMRSVCPWNDKLSSNEWKRIVRPEYTNQRLLEIVEATPRLVHD